MALLDLPPAYTHDTLPAVPGGASFQFFLAQLRREIFTPARVAHMREVPRSTAWALVAHEIAAYLPDVGTEEGLRFLTGILEQSPWMLRYAVVAGDDDVTFRGPTLAMCGRQVLESIVRAYLSRDVVELLDGQLATDS